MKHRGSPAGWSQGSPGRILRYTGAIDEARDSLPDSPWYEKGLRFQCVRCGRCCGGGPGTIRASDAEIEALAKRLGLDPTRFREKYTRKLRRGEVSLREKLNHDCVFYDRKQGCTVYEDRPRQCRTWPFWRSVVHSRETWAEAAERCPGMDVGRLHRRSQIEGSIRNDGTSTSPRVRRTPAV